MHIQKASHGKQTAEYYNPEIEVQVKSYHCTARYAALFGYYDYYNPKLITETNETKAERNLLYCAFQTISDSQR